MQRAPEHRRNPLQASRGNCRARVVACTAAALAISVSFRPACARAQPPRADAAPKVTPPSGEAAALAIELCDLRMRSLLDDLDKGNYRGARSGFDERLGVRLTAAAFERAWESVVRQLGRAQVRGLPQNMLYQGSAVITVPIRFEKGALAARLTCDHDGKVGDFRLLPVSIAEPAPAAGASSR
jgi:Protein of unknown function (DUF3887)